MADHETDGWEDGWEIHAREQRRAWLRLSYAERIAWLEEAKAFVAAVRSAAARARVDPPMDAAADAARGEAAGGAPQE